MAPHNIWIDCRQEAGLEERLDCRLRYGHHLEVDGVPELGGARLWVAAPGREQEALTLVPAANGLAAAFTPVMRGVHTLLGAYDRGLWTVTRDGRYLPGGAGANPGEPAARTVHLGYFAKRLVFVGTQSPWPGSFGQELEIVPLALRAEELEVLVQHRGRALGGTKVYAHCREAPRTRFGVTDTEGKVDFGLTAGEWLLLVRHEVPSPGNEADFRVTNAVFSLTLGR